MQKGSGNFLNGRPWRPGQEHHQSVCTLRSVLRNPAAAKKHGWDTRQNGINIYTSVRGTVSKDANHEQQESQWQRICRAEDVLLIDRPL